MFSGKKSSHRKETQDIQDKLKNQANLLRNILDTHQTDSLFILIQIIHRISSCLRLDSDL
jgi:hypothetical protein